MYGNYSPQQLLLGMVPPGGPAGLGMVPPGGPAGLCDGSPDQASDSGEAALNMSLNCWLQLLSKETSVELHGDSANLAVRVLIALVYVVLCVVGLVGNLLALFLLHSRHHHHRGAQHLHHVSSIDCFVMSLALTDLQFVLTLPFWAVDTALDFRWPFGWLMCKLVSSVTALNMYASVFFLTAMSVARYRSLASALRTAGGAPGGPTALARAKWASLAIWSVALVATLPNAIYSTTVQVSAEDELCLVRFSDSGRWDPQVLLGLYQMQKVLLGFLVPLVVISVCYLLLLRFILSRRAVGSVVSADASPQPKSECERRRHRRRSKVTRSVTVVVLSFFVCWLPNQALTLWGVLIKFDLVPFTAAFYNAQAYAFPLTVCLAHANSCLNPVLYCLVRQEYRRGLKELLLRVSRSARNLLLCHGRRGPRRRGAEVGPVAAEEGGLAATATHKDANM